MFLTPVNLGKSTLKAEFLAEKRDVYDALIGELLDQTVPPAAEILQRMEEGRARNLKETLPAERQTVTLQSVQENLDANTGVLAYWLTASRLAVVWIARGASGVVQRRLTSEDTARVEELGRALTKRDLGAWNVLADAVSGVLLDAGLPLGMAKLVIVPDGVLHALPFEALRGPGGKRLVETSAISYLPSAHFLAANEKKRGRHWPWEVSVAAFADPLPAERGGATPFDAGWPRLPYSAEEARGISKALPGRSRLLIGRDNLKGELFRAGMGDVPVLHFATHGAVDTNDSRRSRLVFTPVEGDGASQYLFSAEIAKLELRGVELVTLAACESERGRYVRGEGVENFSRVFLGAGAGATVSSLWRVSDQASSALMRDFYAGMARGETKAEALRRAKVAMLTAGGERSHPYFWAPYLLSGDGQTPLQSPAPWWPFVTGLVVLALLAYWKLF